VHHSRSFLCVAASLAALFVSLVSCSSPTIAATTTSSDATLSALAVSVGTLSPAFASATTDYTLSVDNSVASLTVTGTATDSGAKLSSNNGVTQTLNVGSNAISITVTAADGTTTKTYTVTATRAESDAGKSTDYTVTFAAPGATTAANPATKTVTPPATTIDALPSSPSKTGYAFAGWWTADNGGGTEFTEATAVTSSVTVYAKWTANSYTVTFSSADATAAASPATKTVTSPATTVDTLPTAPAKTGYVFAGWWTADNGGGTEFTAATKVTASVTVYAKWEEAPLTITFDPNGKAGTVYTQSVKKGATVSLTRMTTFLPDNFCFIGWSTDAKATTPEYIDGASYTAGTSDVKLYAVWVASEVLFEYSEDSNNNVFIEIDPATTMTAFVLPTSIDGKKITTIPEVAFYGLDKIVSVTLPPTVTAIGYGAFQDCTALSFVIIPESVTTIGSGAFLNCSSLSTLTLPASVTTIGNVAFQGTNNLVLTINAVTPPTCDSGSYLHVGLSKVYVLKSTDHSILNAYKTSKSWNAIADKIFEQP
jgi:uncharacterized repeat protein (TIGR02543 family)